MKLFELSGIKHLKDKTPKELIDFIKGQSDSNGSKLKILGAGANGVALTDGTNVFKFWHRDSAYEKFVALCIANKSNPFLPKFKSKIRTLPFNIITGKGDNAVSGIRYVKMELLSAFTPSAKIKIANEGVPTSVEQLLHVMDKDIHSTVYHAPDVLSKVFKQYYPSGSYTPTDEFKLFVETFADIVDIGESMDVHSANMAMRDSQAVILDPIANEDDYSLNMKLFKNIRI